LGLFYRTGLGATFQDARAVTHGVPGHHDRSRSGRNTRAGRLGRQGPRGPRASELATQAYPPEGYGGRRLPGRASQVSDGVNGILSLESSPYVTGEIVHIDEAPKSL